MPRVRLKMYIFPCRMYRTCIQDGTVSVSSGRFAQPFGGYKRRGDRPGSGVLLVDMKYSGDRRCLKADQ